MNDLLNKTARELLEQFDISSDDPYSVRDFITSPAVQGRIDAAITRDEILTELLRRTLSDIQEWTDGGDRNGKAVATLHLIRARLMPNMKSLKIITGENDSDALRQA